jgi:hypothetical protein
MNADTRPGARPRTPLAAAMFFLGPASHSGWQAWAQPRRARRRRGLPGTSSAAPPPTPWAPSTAKCALCLVCDVVGSGLSPRLLPLHGVGAQRCGHLVLFQTKSRPRPRCGSPVPDMSRNKRGLPPRIPDKSNRSPPGSRQEGGSCCVRACVCDACVHVFVQAGT